ncbi:MAG: hypothetical protein NTU53_20170 [Planctomycetota bacterium]|nr:hypothetical protein [Planctomycetota bacterium]
MNRRRSTLSILLIISLLATAAMSVLVQDRHDALLPRPRVASRLSGLDSFAIGLLLGGLRGPLVMVLWASSENQKINKDLEDIDTKIDLIRRLQPEFDSVHIFQMWNKAYNLSVMMANIQNKYAAILDGLDYGRSVLEQRADNLSVLYQMGEIYFNKLGNPVGNPADKRYYNARLAAETLPPLNVASKLQKGQPGWRRTRHDTLLDSNGFILPALLAPPSQAAALAPLGYTGAELQFLDVYNTPQAGAFPYGVHPIALAYNYYKRAAVLQSITAQQHVTIGEGAVASRPAVALKYWADNMWEHARRLEAQTLGKNLPEEKLDLEPLTASLPINAHFLDLSQNTRNLLQEALFTYRRATDVAKHAETEYRQHIATSRGAENADLYFSQIDSAAALVELLAADTDYLAAMAASSAFNPPLVPTAQIDSRRRSAAQHYRKAIDLYYFLILKYYTEDDLATLIYPSDDYNFTTLEHYLGSNLAARVYPWAIGQKFDKANIRNADPALFPKLHAAVTAHVTAKKLFRENAEDIAEYETYIHRATQRLAHLQ